MDYCNDCAQARGWPKTNSTKCDICTSRYVYNVYERPVPEECNSCGEGDDCETCPHQERHDPGCTGAPEKCDCL